MNLIKYSLKMSFPLSSYFNFISKFFKAYAGIKSPLYGSADITNICNLKCQHCYWWKTREVNSELSPEEWKKIIVTTFKKHNVFAVMLTGGEPLLRKDVIKAFIEELPNRVTVVTNGIAKLENFRNFLGYYISIDGDEETHNKIRNVFSLSKNPAGNKINVYSHVRKNIENFVKENGNGKITINMTVNSLNFRDVEKVVRQWYGLAGFVNFQFYTPFNLEDPLWLPFGTARNDLIETIKNLKKEFPNFIINTNKQLDMFKSDWSKKCPDWSVLSLDSRGRMKKPCCIGSYSGKEKPICERCGLAPYSGIYSGVFGNDSEWMSVIANINRKWLASK